VDFEVPRIDDDVAASDFCESFDGVAWENLDEASLQVGFPQGSLGSWAEVDVADGVRTRW
jgi:hypothetical protein